MATNERNPNISSRIIITHGNNGFKSAELLNQMGIPEGNSIEEFKFFPFSDLNNKGSTSQPNSELTSLIEELYQGVEVSAILVLISQIEIFSEGMHSMIQKLPHSKFYGYNQKNEKEWWKQVIIVFSFGEIEKGSENYVVKSIAENRGLKETVNKSGNRYIWISDSTDPTELVHKLRDMIQPMKETLILGGTHSPGYGDTAWSFSHFIPTARVAIRSQEIHKRFIIMGEEQSGKSSLGNLLLGEPEFPAKWSSKLAGKMKLFPIGEVEISSNIAYGNKSMHDPDKMLKVQVLDQPESSNPKQYGEFLGNCISSFATFLITINLNSESFSQQEFTKISDAAQIINTKGFSLYSNAIIIFTHMDESSDQSRESLQQLIVKKLEQEKYAFLKKVSMLVQKRHIFINAVNFGRTNRNEIMAEIFQTIKNPDQKITCDDKSKSGELSQNTPEMKTNPTESEEVHQNQNTESDNSVELKNKNEEVLKKKQSS